METNEELKKKRADKLIDILIGDNDKEELDKKIISDLLEDE